MTRPLVLVALLLVGCLLVTSAQRKKGKSSSGSGSAESPVPCCVALEAAVAALDNRTSDLEACVADVKTDFGDRLAALEMFAMPCPDGYPLRYGDSCYYISADKLNFANAKQACVLKGGKLAEVECEGENEFLKQFARLDGTTAYYLGGSDEDDEGTFVWVSDNRAITFFDWSPRQPDNNGNNEDCLEIRVVSPFNSQWNDIPCFIKNRYICEIR
ncbi:hypothetical protein BaRGS_00018793 [Batillaria attramentaria]|uniref:C-type lectin domain-containing protein n=1 Tax=Batillaria attramentaria TaxID=370345 RepID=A0ABD0KSI0_9CAEN